MTAILSIRNVYQEKQEIMNFILKILQCELVHNQEGHI